MTNKHWKIVTSNKGTGGLKRIHYCRASSRDNAAEWMRNYMDSKLRQIESIQTCSEFEYINNTRRR